MTFSERQIDRRREDTRAGKPSWKRGFTLIECMIYIVVLTVVMGLGFSAFYRFLENWRDLARGSEDILQVLKAGELWRADIRQATAAPQLVQEGELTACEIPQIGGRVAYIFSQGTVWRKTPDKAATPLIPRVQSFAIEKVERASVTAWRWDLELQTRKKAVRVRPLFSFQAVPQAEWR